MSRIERWTRHLLEAEAHKRGVVQPEARSQPELIAAILRHDYASKTSLRNARKFVGNLLGGASSALELLQPPQQERPSVRPAHKLLSSRPPAPEPEPAPPQPTAAEPAPQPIAAPVGDIPARLTQQRRQAELKLHWQVSEQAAERARMLLGSRGELALRVVSVRPDPQHIVQSDVTDHGPVDPSGEWSLLLPSPDAHCVSAVGVRHGDRFVSIVHESSRAVSSSS